MFCIFRIFTNIVNILIQTYKKMYDNYHINENLSQTDAYYYNIAALHCIISILIYLLVKDR